MSPLWSTGQHHKWHTSGQKEQQPLLDSTLWEWEKNYHQNTVSTALTIAFTKIYDKKIRHIIRMEDARIPKKDLNPYVTNVIYIWSTHS